MLPRSLGLALFALLFLRVPCSRSGERAQGKPQAQEAGTAAASEANDNVHRNKPALGVPLRGSVPISPRARV